VACDNTGNPLTYNICVVPVYSRYSLSLNSGGGSKLELLKIPLINDAVISQAPMSISP